MMKFFFTVIVFTKTFLALNFAISGTQPYATGGFGAIHYIAESVALLFCLYLLFMEKPE